MTITDERVAKAALSKQRRPTDDTIVRAMTQDMHRAYVRARGGLNLTILDLNRTYFVICNVSDKELKSFMRRQEGHYKQASVTMEVIDEQRERTHFNRLLVRARDALDSSIARDITVTLHFCDDCSINQKKFDAAVLEVRVTPRVKKHH